MPNNRMNRSRRSGRFFRANYPELRHTYEQWWREAKISISERRETGQNEDSGVGQTPHALVRRATRLPLSEVA